MGADVISLGRLGEDDENFYQKQFRLLLALQEFSALSDAKELEIHEWASTLEPLVASGKAPCQLITEYNAAAKALFTWQWKLYELFIGTGWTGVPAPAVPPHFGVSLTPAVPTDPSYVVNSGCRVGLVFPEEPLVAIYRRPTWGESGEGEGLGGWWAVVAPWLGKAVAAAVVMLSAAVLIDTIADALNRSDALKVEVKKLQFTQQKKAAEEYNRCISDFGDFAALSFNEKVTASQTCQKKAAQLFPPIKDLSSGRGFFGNLALGLGVAGGVVGAIWLGKKLLGGRASRQSSEDWGPGPAPKTRSGG